VCGAQIAAGREVYTNLWEASLKQHPCCSRACAGKFHVDVHWIPPALPTPLEDPRSLERRREAALSRLHRGETPASVVRDLLLAGVAPAGVREILQRVISDLECPPEDDAMRSSQRITFWTGLFGLLVAAFSGIFYVAGSGSGRQTASNADARAVTEAQRIVDAWERHFGSRE
jgi:hypothetical protein